MTKPKAVAYARYSSELQNATSINRQIELAEEYCSKNGMQLVRRWSTRIFVKGGAKWDWGSTTHQFKSEKTPTDLVLTTSEKNCKTDRDVQLTLSASKVPELGSVRFNSMVEANGQYLMVRYRPDLRGGAGKGKPRIGPRH